MLNIEFEWPMRSQSCWWGSSWVGKTTGGSCFQQWLIALYWKESFTLNLSRAKGEAPDRGNYRGLRLTDQTAGTGASFIHLSDSEHRRDEFAFMPSRSTTAAISIAHQLQEKCTATANRQLYFVMYHNARSCVRVDGQYNEGFGVGVGAHQHYT